MTHTEKAIVPRPGLRIDLVLREPLFILIGFGGAGLGVESGTNPVATALFTFLVSTHTRISRI